MLGRRLRFRVVDVELASDAIDTVDVELALNNGADSKSLVWISVTFQLSVDFTRDLDPFLLPLLFLPPR